MTRNSKKVRGASPLWDNDEVDHADTGVAVGKGTDYDLSLMRELKQTQIVRAPTSLRVIATFLAQDLIVAAGVKQQLEAKAGRYPDLHLLHSSLW